MTLPAFLTLVVLALCAHRLQRVLTKDTLTDPIRAWVWAKAYAEGAEFDENGRRTVVVRSKGWRWAWLGIDCPHCVGWWASLGVFALWMYGPYRWLLHPALMAVAVAGLQSFVSSRRDA